MQHYANMLAEFGPVRTFDYAYTRQNRKRPDPLPTLIESHRAELASGRADLGPRVVLAGKSMGGRVGCHVALLEEALGNLCLGYPLRGIGTPPKLRDQVLFDLTKPACFVQGTRDSLCPLDLMQETLAKRKAQSTLHIVETGDHSLQPTKTYLKQSGLTLKDQERETMSAIEKFLSAL